MAVRVSCSGAVLSSLLYEQLRTGHAQEGFLFGTVESHISEHISDSQICNEKMETTIKPLLKNAEGGLLASANKGRTFKLPPIVRPERRAYVSLDDPAADISSFLPCTTVGSFYSGAGELNNEKLSGFLGSNFQHVIGWYRCRGSSCEDLYLRETSVHKQLTKIMTHTGGHFILAVLSCSPSEDSGTFTVCHKFMMQQSNHFEGLPLQVINMGDTSTDEYRLKPRNPAIYTSKAVNSVLSNLSNCEPGILEAENLHSGLVQKLENLLPRFSSAQKNLEDVLQEVNTLRILCSNNGIPVDFTPELCNLSEEPDLMDFEEIAEPSQNINEKEGSHRASVKKNVSRVKKTNAEKGAPDPFGFVNKEMEKLQVRGRGSPTKRMIRSRTNTPSPGRFVGKATSTNESTPRRSSESAGSNEESPRYLSKRSKSSSASSSQRDSQEDNKVKPKATRGLTRTASKDRNTVPRSERSQSPVVINSRANRSNKPKKKEAWVNKSDSGSQEF